MRLKCKQKSTVGFYGLDHSVYSVCVQNIFYGFPVKYKSKDSFENSSFPMKVCNVEKIGCINSSPTICPKTLLFCIAS